MSLARYCFVFSCATICAPACPEQFVRTGVLRVPVGVEQIADRLAGAHFGNSPGQLRRVFPETAVHHRDAVIAGDDNDVATCAGDERERVTQSGGRERGMMALRVRSEGSHRRAVTELWHFRSANEARPGDLAREPWAESNVKCCPPKGVQRGLFPES